MRTAHTTAGLVLAATVLSGLTGCGSAPDDASEKAFCSAMMTGFDKSPGKDDLDGYVETLHETGTPAGISSAEREGFEVLVTALEEADGGQPVDAIADAVEGDDAAKLEKFYTYFFDTCLDGSVPDEALVTTGKE